MKPVVYSRPGCPWCTVIKNWLEEKGIEYVSKDVSVDPEARKELLETYKSRGVPTTVIGEEVIVGFDEEKLKQLLGL